jgi:hypothetical protein
LAVLLVGLNYASGSVTRVTVALPTFGIVDPPLSMRVTAICRSDQMPATTRVRRPTALAVGDDGVYVADAERGMLERWNVGTCRPLASTPVAGELRGLAWRASGELVALEATGGRALLFTSDLRPTGQVDLRAGGVTQPRGLAVDENRMAILNADGSVATFDLEGQLIARFAGVPGGVGQFGATAVAPHRDGLLIADPGNGRVHLVSWDGDAVSTWTPPAPTTELAAGPRGIAVGTSPRAGAVVALAPSARGFVTVSGPEGAPLRVGGDVLAADADGHVAGSSPDGIILLGLAPAG